MRDFREGYAFAIQGLRPPPPFASSNDAQAFLRELTGIDEISNVAYLGIALPGADPAEEPYVVSTYSEEWSRHYFAQRYFDVDPAVVVGMAGILPFDWHSRSASDKRSRGFFEEAVEFGLCWTGLSIPIRGAQGERALFSINSPLEKRDWYHFKTTHMGELTILAYLFHLRMLASRSPQDLVSKPSLRPREREVLRWASCGKSSWETGQILGLTEATINFYVRNAAMRLGAVNRTQAVAVALTSHLL